ncbi:MAG: WcaI family glycosyltransferase [Cytophagaceae bacterium]
MKILIYGINYTPELTGIGKYTGEMGAWLASQGQQVDVITAPPYYPEWNVHTSYKGKLWHTENVSGATVHRCPLYVPKKVSGMKRILHEISFGVSSSLFWFRKLFIHYDIIFTPYPPLIIGVWPWMYKWFHPKAKWIFHIQDLQVDAAKELHLIKNKTLLSIFENTEKFWLKKATIVSSISEGMKARILKKGVPASKYLMIPNWADTDFIQPLPANESLRAEFNISPETKVIMYSGNLGEKQGVEIIPDLAIAMPEYHFLIAGEGASKTRLQEAIKEKGIKNIQFVSLQPYSKLPNFLATANVHLVLQKKSAADLVLPSKFITLLSAGATSVVTAEPGTSLYDIVVDNQTAYLCEPENLGALIQSIKNAINEVNPDIPQNARNYALAHLNKHAILKRVFGELV